MSEDIGVDEVECIDAGGDNHHELEVTVVGVVEAVDAGGGIVGVVGKVGGAVVVDAVEILILELRHASVVVVYGITHASESTVDDRDLPSLTVVDLAATGDERQEESLGGRMFFGDLQIDGLGRRLDFDTLGL